MTRTQIIATLVLHGWGPFYHNMYQKQSDLQWYLLRAANAVGCPAITLDGGRHAICTYVYARHVGVQVLPCPWAKIPSAFLLKALPLANGEPT